MGMMCGITGFIDPSLGKQGRMKEIVLKMADAISHRGPDEEGVFVDPAHGVAFGFRRLAVLDLSPTGHQPMVSSNGRFVIIFNGEVYNHNDLRQELVRLGHNFRGSSDTEVVLEAISEWDILVAVGKLNGMFAFALWDKQDKRLLLVTDRLGIKPLYYGWNNGVFLFGSVLKALRANPSFRPEIDRNSLALFLRHNYIPKPYSIYQGIRKLPGGSILTMDPGQPLPRISSYWSAREVAETGFATPFRGSEAAALQQLESLLSESVRLRMIADVPLGAFLSGGVDSSMIVALMQAQSSGPVKTFTIGFHETAYNEAEHAKVVAEHLKTDHTEFYVTPREALDVIPLLPGLYDEPFSDSSQIPTYLAAKLARQDVTVVLSGDGGDELFAGYTRYAWAELVWNRLGRLPPGVRKGISRLLKSRSPEAWQSLYNRLEPLIPGRSRQTLVANKIFKLGEILLVDSPQEMYRWMVSHWTDPSAVVLDGIEPPTQLTDRERWPDIPEYTPWMMAMDLLTYLPDDGLVKVDRATMGVGLEARVPLLDDHRVVEFAWSLPLKMKIRPGKTKWLLRQLLYKYVPPSLIERPKMGFAMPIDAWLRGPLRDWAESLLDENRLRREGFFNPEPIRQKLAAHLAGQADYQYPLWDVLMFESWLDTYS